MSIADTYTAYAAAFELSYTDNDWSRLQRYFAQDAIYRPGDGKEIAGRDALFQHLAQSITELDQRFDTRSISDTSNIRVQGEVVIWPFSVTYQRAGVPDLVLAGEEHAHFRDGVITLLEDHFSQDSAAGMMDWLDRHSSALKPVQA